MDMKMPTDDSDLVGIFVFAGFVSGLMPQE